MPSFTRTWRFIAFLIVATSPVADFLELRAGSKLQMGPEVRLQTSVLESGGFEGRSNATLVSLADSSDVQALCAMFDVVPPTSVAAHVGSVGASDRTAVFAMRAIVTVLGCFMLMALYGYSYEIIEERTGFKISHMCCIVYATLSITIDLSIKNAAQAYGGKFPFDPSCAVVVVEYTKLVVSLILFAVYSYRAKQSNEEIALPSCKDVGWLAVPALIYAANNLIVFQAIKSTSLAAFGVIRETMLIWNALLWTATFRMPISAVRWMAIGGIFLGCSINQFPQLLDSHMSSGVLWAFLLAFSNAAGAVANEYAMKQRAAIDINLQNSIMYVMCGSFVLLFLAIVKPATLASPSVFFTGFVPECWQIIILQVFTGLAVSRILKYVEAVTKTIVAALRGPGVIFIGAMLFHTKLHASEVAATLVVCLSCWVYLREGPLLKPANPKAR